MSTWLLCSHKLALSSQERLVPKWRCRLQPRRSAVGNWSRDRWDGVMRAQVATTELQRWLESTVEPPVKVQLTEREENLEMRAQESFREGDSVCSMTEDKWISLQTVSESSIGPFVRNLEPWLQLTIFLMSQRSEPETPWELFLKHLPQGLNSPAYWTENELDSIEGTQLHESAIGYRQFFKQKFAELESELFGKNAELFNTEDFAFESFCWAVGIVRSHVHPPLSQEQIALVPIISKIGHARDGNVELKLKSGNLFQKTSMLSAQATRNIASGETLQMDYGVEKSDSQIALEYGTVDLVNPQLLCFEGGYSLSLQLPESDANYDDKLDILDVCGMQEPVVFEFLPNADPPEDLLLFLRLLNLSGPDAFHLEAIFRNEIQDHLAFPVSEDNESNICDTMITGCKEALQAYQRIDYKKSPTAKQELMKKVCYGEQQTLEWIQLWFQRRKENLKGLEYYAERRLKRLGLLDDKGQSTFEDMLDSGIA